MDEPIFQQNDDPIDYIVGYFEDLLSEGEIVVGADSLEELYEAGAPERPADEYLWNLSGKQGENIKFSSPEYNELKEQNELIQAADYPQYLKDAISELLKREKARNEGRNLSRGKAAGILNTNARRANLVGNNMPAMKKALAINAFPSMIGRFLTDTPRITKESRGSVEPALTNLRGIAEGQEPAPLRPYGTGTGGRRKTKKSKKPKRKTRAVKKHVR